MDGLHIISDLYGCNTTTFQALGEDELILLFKDIVTSSGLNVVGNCIHMFGLLSFTLVILLEESHISMHTRPEYNYISLDIFVCNYQKDNTKAAKTIFEEIKKVVGNKQEITKFLTRKMMI